MNTQNYKNHRRFIFLFHFITFFLIVLLFISSIYYTITAMSAHTTLKPGLFLFLVSVIFLFLFFFCRIFALKAQDRAIRMEENFRHYLITGKTLDPKLTIRQIIGLRFASDDEYIDFCKKAVEKNMSEEEIKKSIINWKGDYYRV